MTEIQYEYAFDQADTLLHIEDITPEIRKEKDFTCPECGLKMIARLGQKRAHHFMHDGQPCGIESYTHKIGKLIFYQRYTDALESRTPVTIYADVPVMCDHCSLGPCPLEHNFKRMDLTRRYKKNDLEKQIAGGLIPDILLTDDKGKHIFVEIHVTSPCSPEKLASGVSIIEFHLEGPEDFDLLLAEPIQAGDEISFHNFPWTRRKATEMECGKALLDVFIIYPSKKCFLPQRGTITKPHTLPRGTYLQPIQYGDILSHSEITVWESERAYYVGIPITNCFLCQHHVPEVMLNKVYCQKESYKENKHSAAAKCRNYLQDPEHFRFRNITNKQIEEHKEKMDKLYKSGNMGKLLKPFYKTGALTITAKEWLESGSIQWVADTPH
jgi:predicted RNA-binding Zn-ribbon protein involved in translation (DUF1610 family)